MSITLYHYTNCEGMVGIMSSGRIRSSIDLNRDAVLGRGVYFCDLPPSGNKTINYVFLKNKAAPK